MMFQFLSGPTRVCGFPQRASSWRKTKPLNGSVIPTRPRPRPRPSRLLLLLRRNRIRLHRRRNRGSSSSGSGCLPAAAAAQRLRQRQTVFGTHELAVSLQRRSLRRRRRRGRWGRLDGALPRCRCAPARTRRFPLFYYAGPRLAARGGVKLAALTFLRVAT